MESVAAFAWNGWQASSGISGNLGLEYADTLKRVLPRARSLTDKPILLRLDSAHDARANRDFLREQDQVDFLIKWNPRKEDPLVWADKAQARKAWSLERDGKMEAVLSEAIPDEPELLSNLVYDHQAAFLSDWSSTSIPS